MVYFGLTFMEVKLKIALPLFLMSSLTFAGVTSKVVMNETYKNRDCKKTNSCDLTKFNILIKDYITSFGSDKMYGTSAHIAYETKSVSDLESYGVVQFIKGCAYTRYKNADGSFNNLKNVAREFYGEYQKFDHPKWVIDSIDHDPLYNSYDASKNRHGYYRWNDNKKSFSKNGEHYYFNETPSFPRLYVSDYPALASAEPDYAKNVSLAFKTCIYKSSDIPLVTTPEEIDFATPIHCFDWTSSYTYDFDKKAYNRSDKIDPFCM